VATRLERLALWAGSIWLLAGSPVPAATNAMWFTHVWQTDDGLFNNNVSAIVQSRDEYLWVVTPVSLMRFDGVSFSSFPIKDFTGRIAPHNIRTVLYTRTGVLWIVPNLGRMIGLNADFSVVTLPQSGLPQGAPWVLWVVTPVSLMRFDGVMNVQLRSRIGD
jgi:ligand-binding sensor domain-containing protein